MLHDSTIARGRDVPVIKLKPGKNINLINTKIIIIEKIQPFKLSSFHSKNQKSFRNFLDLFLNFIERGIILGF